MDETTFDLFQKDFEIMINKYSDKMSFIEILGSLDIARTGLEQFILQPKTEQQPNNVNGRVSASTSDKIKKL